MNSPLLSIGPDHFCFKGVWKVFFNYNWTFCKQIVETLNRRHWLMWHLIRVSTVCLLSIGHVHFCSKGFWWYFYFNSNLNWTLFKQTVAILIRRPRHVAFDLGRFLLLWAPKNMFKLTDKKITAVLRSNVCLIEPMAIWHYVIVFISLTVVLFVCLSFWIMDSIAELWNH